MVIEIGRVTVETRGPDMNRRYEPLGIDIFCDDTGVLDPHGSKYLPDCSA